MYTICLLPVYLAYWPRKHATCWATHVDHFHQVWSWYDCPSPSHSVFSADTSRDLATLTFDLLTLDSGQTWQVAWATPPPSLKILRLSVIDLWVMMSATSVSASGAVQENDVITMACSVTYRGNWAPVMRWFNSVTRHNFTNNITLRTINTTVTSELTVTTSAGLHGSQIICLTYFTQPSASLPTSATNIPRYTYEWTSPTLIVQCK